MPWWTRPSAHAAQLTFQRSQACMELSDRDPSNFLTHKTVSQMKCLLDLHH